MELPKKQYAMFAPRLKPSSTASTTATPAAQESTVTAAGSFASASAVDTRLEANGETKERGDSGVDAATSGTASDVAKYHGGLDGASEINIDGNRGMQISLDPLLSKWSTPTVSKASRSRIGSASLKDRGTEQDGEELSVQAKAKKTKVNHVGLFELGMIDMDASDDDILVVGSASTSNSVAQSRSERPALPVKAKAKAKSNSKSKAGSPFASSTTSSRSQQSTTIIIIDDDDSSSPARKGPRMSRFASSSSSSAFVGNLNKKQVKGAEYARWPSAEEHGCRLLERQSSTSQHGRWIPKFGKLDSDASSSTLTPQFPSLVYHPPSFLASLVPSYPQHPLLDRLAAPFRQRLTDSGSLKDSSSFMRRPFSRLTSSGDGRNDDESRERERELWTTRFAPRSASEVLGEQNGRSAMLLKEWLCEMKIGGRAQVDSNGRKQHRRSVRRNGVAGARKRGRSQSSDDDLDAFIAAEDTSSDRSDASDGESDDYGPRRTSPRYERFPSLTSLILLVGPVGSGKTSTIRAIVEELGWDIFEVNPGMGRRAAKGLDSMVGDVARNHTVRKNNSIGGAAATATGFFAKRKVDMAASAKTKAVCDDGGQGKAHGASSSKRIDVKGESDVRQSVIVLEEVDLLFRKEEDFWSGVVDLVRESKRPMIMTCNDVSIIPFGLLPFQQIVFDPHPHPCSYLPFCSPSPSLVLPFLQLSALHDGHILSSSSVEQSYNASAARDPSWLKSGEEAMDRDLRKTMMAMQFNCQWGIGDKSGGVGWMDLQKQARDGKRIGWSLGKVAPTRGDDVHVDEVDAGDASKIFEQVSLRAESRSFCDAFVERRREVFFEEHEPAPSAVELDSDLILGYSHIQRILPPARNDLAINTIEASFSRFIYTLTHTYDRSPAEEALESKRLATIAATNTIIYTHPTLCSLPFNPNIFTLYLPALRSITFSDDIAQAHALSVSNADADMSLSTNATSARVTRRSMRSNSNVYKRRIDWSDEAARLVRQSGFLVVDEVD